LISELQVGEVSYHQGQPAPSGHRHGYWQSPPIMPDLGRDRRESR
jgi:hypothetical protein